MCKDPNPCPSPLSCSFKVLWPYLLEFIVPAEYTEAIGTVCKCLATLGAKLRDADVPEEEDDPYELDYDVQVNLPRPHDLIARLMVIVGHPLERGRGECRAGFSAFFFFFLAFFRSFPHSIFFVCYR